MIDEQYVGIKNKPNIWLLYFHFEYKNPDVCLS